MPMVRKVLLTCPEARDLKCPYTGKELQVYANISEGIVTYSAPDAFSLRVPVGSVTELYKRASMRNGFYGAVDEEKSILDAYTGQQFSLVETDDGKFRFEGGFDPTCPCLSLAEFVLKASGGKRVLQPAPAMESVEKIDELKEDDSDLAHKAVEDITEGAAHEIVNAIPGAKKTKVGYRGE